MTFGVGLADLVATKLDTKHHGRQLPRVLVFLCEYLQDFLSSKANTSGPRTPPLAMILASTLAEPIEPDMVAAVRERFCRGDLYDCRSPPCMLQIFKAFLRELPRPILPTEFYPEFIAIVVEQVQTAVRAVRESQYYNTLLVASQDRDGRLDTWLLGLFTEPADYVPGLESSSRRLEAAVLTVAMSVRQPCQQLEELFFRLPRLHRDVLEYLGVMFARLDLLARSEIAVALSPLLLILAETFSCFVMRPEFWAAAHSTGYRHRLHVAAMLALVALMKRKHNLITSSERTTMQLSGPSFVDTVLQNLLQRGMATSSPRLARRPSMNSVASSLSAGSRTSRTTMPQPRTPLLTRAGLLAGPPTPAPSGYPTLGAALGSPVVAHTDRVTPSPGPLAPPSLRARVSPAAITPPLRPRPLPTRETPAAAVKRPVPNLLNTTLLRSVVLEESFESRADSTINGSDVHEQSREDCDELNVSTSQIEDEEEEEEENEVFQPAGPPVWYDWQSPISEMPSLADAPNLRQWLREPCIPWADPCDTQFVLPSGATPQSRHHHHETTTVDGSAPPGEGLRPLLGPAFRSRSASALHSLDTTHANLRSLPPSTRAINYDYAMSFPRTLADPNRELDPHEPRDRLLHFAARPLLEPYAFETEPGLLRHDIPPRGPEGEACEECGCALPRTRGLLSFGSNRTHCRYCGRLLCLDCCRHAALVPAYIINKGDFKVHSLCGTCDTRLALMSPIPAIILARLCPRATQAFGPDKVPRVLALCRSLQQTLFAVIFPDCPSRHILLSLVDRSLWHYIAPYPYGPRISFAELAQHQLPLDGLTSLAALLQSHVSFCASCRRVRKRECAAGGLCTRPGDRTSMTSQPASPATPAQAPTHAVPISSIASSSRATLASRLVRPEDAAVCGVCGRPCHPGCLTEMGCLACAAVAEDLC
eukprot:m.124428 g.124428  ORF g.124428 m.124428 type:complete len:933 (+) comp14649_c3_seq1:144-2942(+)